MVGDVSKIVKHEVEGDENILKTKVERLTTSQGLVRSARSGSIRKFHWRLDSENRAAERESQNQARRLRRQQESPSERKRRLEKQAESQRRCRQRRQNLIKSKGLSRGATVTGDPYDIVKENDFISAIQPDLQPNPGSETTDSGITGQYPHDSDGNSE